VPKTSTDPGKEIVRVDRDAMLRNQFQAVRAAEVRRWHREMAAPVAAFGGTWLLGESAHLIELAAQQPLCVAASAAATTACATFLARWRLAKVWSPRWSSRFWAAGASATGWDALAAVAGPHWAPGWLLTGGLAAATAGLAGRWWREHRLHVTPQLMPAAPVDEDDEDDDVSAEPVTGGTRIQERWETFFSARGKKFENSILTGETELATGWQFECLLDPDKNDVGDLVPVRRRIAAVMGLSAADILIEPHPTGAEDRALLSFLIVNPLKDGVPYQGPRYDCGFIDVGMFADGTGWGSVQITDHENSVINGLATGDPGSGKSVFLENLGMSALHSRRWKVFYCDGSEDADSSVLLNDHMTWSTAGLNGAWAQLEAVKKYMRARGLETRSIGGDVRGVNPSPERIALLWIIDEFHRLAKADQKFASEIEAVVRLGRKKGVAVWVATQGLGLDDFAGMPKLRDILTSRNIVAFYSSSKYAHTLVSGVNIAPNTLPTGGGYAYLSRPGMPNRAAMLRTDFAPDMTPWARALPDAPWDKLGLLSVRKIMDQHRVSPEEARDQAMTALADYTRALEVELMLGDDDEPEPPAKPMGFSDLRARLSALGDLRVVPEDAVKTSKTDAIIDELRKRGTATTGEIAKAVGVGLSTVSTTLGRAAKKPGSGIEDRGQGKWAAGAVGTGEGVA
jgi:hypothetical protein